MFRVNEEFFHKNIIVAKSLTGFAFYHSKGVFDFFFFFDQAHTAATAAGRSL